MEDEKNKLSLAQREAAQVASTISAEQAQQAQLDVLALRYDTDCLKAEDRIEELKILRNCSKKDLEAWAEAEKARRNAATNAASVGDGYGREVAQLRRQLDDACLESAAALSQISSQIAAEKSTDVKLQGALAALSAARGDVTSVRRRLDTVECALAARNIDIKKAESILDGSDHKLGDVESRVTEAKAALDAEVATGKVLTQAITDTERKCIREEERAATAQKDLDKAQQAVRTAEMVCLRTEAEATRMEVAAKQAVEKAQQAAGDLDQSLQHNHKMQDAIDHQEDLGRSTAERQADCESLAAAERQRLHHLDQHISDLSKQRDRLQQETVDMETKCCDKETGISQARAQSAALTSNIATLAENLAHHQVSHGKHFFH